MTRYDRGTKTADGPGDAQAIVREHGLAHLLPPPRTEPRSFVLAEARRSRRRPARSACPCQDPARSCISKRARGTLGWTEGQVLGALAAKMSRKLSAPVHAILDAPPAFQVSVYEAGKRMAAFEEPPTAWSEGLRVTSILGGESRASILRLVDAPDT